jgi:HK97 family phage portal protein
MNLLQRIFGGAEKPSAAQPRAMAGDVFHGLDDPRLLEYIRQGGSAGGTTVGDALKNTAVLRSVDLISGVIGRLPLNIKEVKAKGAVAEATTHPLHNVLMHKPNAWQNANQFKSLMQTWALVHGNAVAQIITLQGRVVAFNPLHPTRVSIEQRSDFSLEYQVTGQNNLTQRLEASQVLHIRGPSEDGYKGWSPVKQAADVIQAHVDAQRASARVFKNGMMVGGNLSHPGKMSNEAYDRLRASMEDRSGAENAGKWIITEEGMTASPFASTAVDAQLVEFRAALVEDIGRVFGVPRPLLGVDDTSWGSGIEQLAILFIRFGLAPWFDAWEQEIKIKCLRPSEWDRFTPDFEERELLRGTIKEQFEAYAKAAGAGGHMPWMETNEIRRDLGLGDHADGFGLKQAGMTNEQTEPVQTASV